MATYKTKKPYMYGTGRRKSSIARVHLIPNGSGVITINGRDIDDYFGLETLKLIVRQPLVTTGTVGKVDIEATVAGGGVSGQAGAIRHGIARALLVVDENNRAALKAAGLLTRDPRMKERKKYGVQQALIRFLQAPAFRRVLVFLCGGRLFGISRGCRVSGEREAVSIVEAPEGQLRPPCSAVQQALIRFLQAPAFRRVLVFCASVRSGGSRLS